MQQSNVRQSKTLNSVTLAIGAILVTVPLAVFVTLSVAQPANAGAATTTAESDLKPVIAKLTTAVDKNTKQCDNAVTQAQTSAVLAAHAEKTAQTLAANTNQPVTPAPQVSSTNNTYNTHNDNTYHTMLNEVTNNVIDSFNNNVNSLNPVTNTTFNNDISDVRDSTITATLNNSILSPLPLTVPQTTTSDPLTAPASTTVNSQQNNLKPSAKSLEAAKAKKAKVLKKPVSSKPVAAKPVVAVPPSTHQ